MKDYLKNKSTRYLRSPSEIAGNDSTTFDEGSAKTRLAGLAYNTVTALLLNAALGLFAATPKTLEPIPDDPIEAKHVQFVSVARSNMLIIFLVSLVSFFFVGKSSQDYICNLYVTLCVFGHLYNNCFYTHDNLFYGKKIFLAYFSPSKKLLKTLFFTDNLLHQYYNTLQRLLWAWD
jgi:biopolymer transport protein ExbB/TolQ